MPGCNAYPATFPSLRCSGNHGVKSALNGHSIALADFLAITAKFGYDNPEQLYYTWQSVCLSAVNWAEFQLF